MYVFLHFAKNEFLPELNMVLVFPQTVFYLLYQNALNVPGTYKDLNKEFCSEKVVLFKLTFENQV